MSISPSPRPLAVVSCASSGIGLELAKQFAEHDFDLVIAAQDDELATAASTLQALGATVESVQVDLATNEGVAELAGRIRALGRPIAAIALNAGRGAGGEFAGLDAATATSLEDELEIV